MKKVTNIQKETFAGASFKIFQFHVTTQHFASVYHHLP